MDGRLGRYVLACLLTAWPFSKDLTHLFNNLLQPVLTILLAGVPIPLLGTALPVPGAFWVLAVLLFSSFVISPFRLWLQQIREIDALNDRLQPKLELLPGPSSVGAQLYACLTVNNLRPESPVTDCQGRVNGVDLFTSDEVAFRAALVSVPIIAGQLGGRVEILTDAPAFRRVLLTSREGEAVRLDLVVDGAERVGPPPIDAEGLRLDPPEEILANKLCAMLGRSEPRDLVDLFCLERAGHDILAALPAARRKDAGMTPGQLAWALSQVSLDRPLDGMLTPVSLEELRAFRARLRDALERLSFPA